MLCINSLKVSRQPTLVQMATKRAPLDKKKALTTKIAVMITVDVQPHNVVEGHDFTVLMEEAVLNCALPSRMKLACDSSMPLPVES